MGNDDDLRKLDVPTAQDVVRKHAAAGDPQLVEPVPIQPETDPALRADVSTWELLALWAKSRLQNAAMSELAGKPVDLLPVNPLAMALDWPTLAVAVVLILGVFLFAILVR